MAEDVLNIDFGEMYAFDMVDGDKTVGQMNVSVHRQKTSSRGENQIYPDSWFIGDSEQLKPVLEIDGFGTVGNQGGGYGRAGLQRAYEMSLDKGCGGRVEVHATWGAGSFYEHCGFVGKNKGQPGIKYFEPTEENIATLYKGGKRENLNLQTAKPMDFGDFSLDDIHSPVDDFIDIVNMPYDDTSVDKNIKDLLSGKGYQPDYKYRVKDFLVAEQANLAQSLNPDKFTHHLAFSEDLCNASGFADSKKINDFIDGFNFSDTKQRESLQTTLTEEVPINFAAGYVFAKPNAEKQEIVSFCGFVENPMYSLYTDVHEFAHVVQHPKFYPNIMEKLETATDERSQKIRDVVMRGYREIHANAFAGAYMMAMAVRSGNPEVIDKVEKMVTQTSTFMSNALINSKLGAAYCDWGATKRVIADIKQNGADKLFNENGRIDFNKLYDFSFAKVKEMGYTPEMLLNAYDNEGETVRKIKAETKDKAEMIAEVNKIKGNNPILNDFAEAQTLYNPNNGNQLHTFYSRLANPKNREKTLFDKQYDNLPNITQYRELYTATQKQIQAQLINKVRS